MKYGTESIDAVSLDNSSADLQKLEDPKAVSMVQPRNIEELRQKIGLFDGVNLVWSCPASTLISEEHLVDNVRSSGSRGVGTETPSPLPTDGMSPYPEGGGPPSLFKKPKRRKKKRSSSSIPHD
ncbi:hypothetical protein Nepgr_030909 [Nepenthes gracilis]|uniref:Uncharacterized protein n=1 Tax=Nepenthes gracilis TaxID=150966 RepID=A0AAD3TH44_NEPGR|nr:hypothetical protein Nepgr_030909 [Nepenthes gracilis]